MIKLPSGDYLASASDVAGFLACHHLTTLDRTAASGALRRPSYHDPAAELLAVRGAEHEEACLRALRQKVGRVVEIAAEGVRAKAVAETLAALREGAPAIYQAALEDGSWRGRADFLVRVDRPSGLGAWSYEVIDAKLARQAKVWALIQLCLYSELLRSAQGALPEWMHLELGGGRGRQTFRVATYLPYFRRVRSAFAVALEAPGPSATYPEPVEHCDVCDWFTICRQRWRDDDHLSLVAGIGRSQRKALEERSIGTVADLAALALPLDPPLERVGPAALTRIHQQASIQVRGRDPNRVLHELLTPVEPELGLAALPPPSSGDLFLDIEGDPYALGEGLEYLFGVVEIVRGEPRYTRFWAHDRAEERSAFEMLVAFMTERLGRSPDLHVYHYNHYEPTALKHLAGRFGTCVEELDRFLRGRVFVDLYRAVRQGLRASVERYSIKNLEPLYGFERTAELREASRCLRAFVSLLELGGDRQKQAGVEATIEAYNKDDCLSAWRLRDWLEAERRGLETLTGTAVPRPAPRESAPSEQLSETQARVQALIDLLLVRAGGVTESAAQTTGRSEMTEPAAHNAEPAEMSAAAAAEMTADLARVAEAAPQVPAAAAHMKEAAEIAGDADGEPPREPGPRARWLLAQMLEWHRREERSAWWEYYRLCDLSDAELQEDKSALGGLAYLGPVAQVKKSIVHRYRFPPQEHAIGRALDVHDPRTGQSAGSVVAIDDGERTIDLRRGVKSSAAHPLSLVPSSIVPTKEIRASLERLGSAVVEGGITGPGPHRAARDLLLRARPRLLGTNGIRGPGESAENAARRLALALDETVLPIQGPPGTGKTHTAAGMIVELVKVGRRVGITANSHKVIVNLLEKVLAVARSSEVPLRAIQKASRNEDRCVDPRVTCTEDNGEVQAALASGEVTIGAGTAWLWARGEMEESVDVLFVDEAGQMSLASTLAIAQAARSLVLIGDPQQLDQPQQGVHPPGAEVSALGHLVGRTATMEPGQGLFLDETYRMHPDVCGFISEVFYDGRLAPRAENLAQRIDSAGPLGGTGLRFVPIEHRGNRNESVEEAVAVASLIGRTLGARATWTDGKGRTRPLTAADILVVAPYNAQVAALARRLPEGVAVGTVDRFQGQEAPIVIYSMATSTPEDAPRGMEFLYSPNRLNVAISRARCVAALVASPDLFQVRCRTSRQMELAGAFCRFLEIAAPPDPRELPAPGTSP